MAPAARRAFHQAVVDFYGTPLEAIADALSESWPRLMCDGLQYDVAREALDALTHTFTLHLRETVIADLQKAGHLAPPPPHPRAAPPPPPPPHPPPGPPTCVHDPDTPPTKPLTPREATALHDVQVRAKNTHVNPALIAYRIGHADGRACLEFPTDLIAPEPGATEPAPPDPPPLDPPPLDPEV
jgi:hypothetical protein